MSKNKTTKTVITFNRSIQYAKHIKNTPNICLKLNDFQTKIKLIQLRGHLLMMKDQALALALRQKIVVMVRNSINYKKTINKTH